MLLLILPTHIVKGLNLTNRRIWLNLAKQLVRFGNPEKSNEMTESCRGVLHLTVSNLCNNSISIIEQRKKIIRKLLKLNGLLLIEKDKQGCKPIVSPFAHVDLSIELINLGASVLAGNELEETILHIAAGYMSPSDYNKLVHSIPQSTISGMLKSRLISSAHHFTPFSHTLIHLMKQLSCL